MGCPAGDFKEYSTETAEEKNELKERESVLAEALSDVAPEESETVGE